MSDITILAWVLVAVAFVVGAGIGFTARRPRTIVEDADAKRLEHLALRNAALEEEVERKQADAKAWADSHRAVTDELEETKGKLESAQTPPELVEAREKVEELTAEVERLQAAATEVETLNAELDTARGRAAALERELTAAKTVPQMPVEDFTKVASLEERVGVLTGELDAAQTRIAELEAQIGD